MSSSLRTYLEEIDGNLLRVKKEVDPLTQLGALSSQSDRTIMFENLRGYPGWTVCDRLLATREQRAVALRTTPEKLLQDTAACLARGKGESRMVADAPVKGRIITGEDIDLFSLPIGISSMEDGGRYIGSGMCVTKDPDTGLQNEAYYRIQVKSRNRATFVMGRRVGWATFAKHEAAGEPMPIAIVIGHHPAYEIAAAYPGNHEGYEEFELAATFLQEPVEFVRCETSDLRVPAHAEIVIEGVALPGVRESEGPYGEYTGYYGSTDEAFVLEVRAITMREDAIYRHLQSSRITDLQALSTLFGEVNLYTNLQRSYGRTRILDVHLPQWALLSVIVQMAPEYEGHARAVLLTALGLHRLAKVVIAVDDDVDIHDPKDVIWALANRVNPATDVITVSGMRGFHLDPSTPDLTEVERIAVAANQVNGVMGIDATKAPTRRPAERASYNRARPVGEGEVFLKDFL